jgi:uncharacterized membrane protein
MAPAHPLGGEFLRQVGLALHIQGFGGLPMGVKFFLSIFSKYQKYALTIPSEAWLCCLSLLVMTVVVLLLSSWLFERQNVAFRN